MSTVIALNQPRVVRLSPGPLSIEGLRAVMLRRGRVIRSLRRKVHQLANDLIQREQDLDEANAYIAELENRLDEAEETAAETAAQLRTLTGGAAC